MLQPVRRSTVPFSRAEDAAAELFGALHAGWPQAPAAFLDSSDHARTPAPQRSRFSILAFSQGDLAEQVTRASDIWDWVAGVWEHTGTTTAHTSQGFQLGWVGWAGYEGQGAFFRATHAVVVDHHSGAAELQTLSPAAPGEHQQWRRMVTEQIAGLGRHPAPRQQMQLEDLQVRDCRADYLEAIAAAQEQIRRGITYEVCLTTAVTAQLRADPWEAYLRLREANRAPFTQYLAPAGQGGEVILSTSPERFVQVSAAGVIRSEPIKGTRPRGATRQQDAQLRQELAASVKDRAENVMIADLVRNDLSIRAVPGSLRVERLCAVETYPSVHQMVSTIGAQLEPESPRAAAVAAAFPPGSMTGAPKISTMGVLARLETGPRGPYSGAAGYFSTNGACDLSVLIRTAVLSRTPELTGSGDRTWQMHLGLGGAITADSDPQAEWEEIITKSRGVLGALGAQFPSR